MTNPLSIVVLQYLGAYEKKNRDALEAVLSADFTFTSPVDDHIDRQAYFERCWPNNAGRKSFRVEKFFSEGNECFVTYEGERTSGAKFRNTEFIRIENGQITHIDVYFGPDQGDTPFPHVPPPS
ncbi:hypothetical protein AYO41_03190 [Verrucomicrobia bacterium SCGC AG-212-E04]|nr:hypothetical protein AYO41_03190 [Verrucomicrobia bacterium SCGC AG-212-E04]